MAYAEKRGRLWRARWRAPDGTLESKPGFRTRKEAEKYGRDQEAAIRKNTYVDPRAGRITLTEWVNQWYPALDLEPTTLSNYRYRIEVLVLPKLGNRALNDLSTEEIATWEMDLVRQGYARRTARDAIAHEGDAHDPVPSPGCILCAGSTMQARSDTDAGMTDHDPLPFCSQNRTSGEERLGR